jgi:O-antigen/teichoic acid export membrane protein
MDRSIKAILSGSLIGVIGKVVSAALNFISLPLLLTLYGKSNSGLINIALTTNAFLQVVNMGVPIGAVKFFSQWIESKNYTSLKRGMQTNVCFFSVIGLINSTILIYVGLNAENYFNVPEVETLRMLIFIIAVTSLVNWYFTPIQHLLLAFEKISAVNLSNLMVTLANFVVLVVAYFMKVSLVTYFLAFSITNLLSIPVNIYSCKRLAIIKKSMFYPRLWRSEFRVIMTYSFGLFGMMIIQFLANQSQPLILGTMSHSGDIAVADYAILKKITMLVSLMGGIFLQSFMPHMSKMSNRNDKANMEEFVVNSTKWLSIFIFYICFFIAFNSQRILDAYVGEAGKGLGIWLSIWMLGLLFLNNQAIGSLVLSIGRFKSIIVALLIATIPTLLFSFLFVNKFGVGIAAGGFLIYKTIESFYMFGYFLPRVAGISAPKLLNGAMKLPLLISIAATVATKFILLPFDISNNFFYLVLFGCISLVVYALINWKYVISSKEQQLIATIFANARLKMFGVKKVQQTF